MSNIYTSKYPTITTDNRPNSAIESVPKKLTVEEYYDLKHHTHDISTLATPKGTMSYDQMQTTVNELTNLVNNFDNILQEQTNTIKQQNDIIQKLEVDTTELKNLINSQNNTISSMKAEMANMASVSDWDVETPGNQDVNGNDLGELMGFTMTEIVE